MTKSATLLGGFFLSLFFPLSYTMAQVGINTTLPNPSSMLDVVSSDSGVLITRVSLTDVFDQTTIINGNVQSLLVYNIASQNDVTPGYYYWNDGRWQRLTTRDEVEELISNNTSLASSLVDNGDGTFTHTSGGGTVTTFDANTTAVVDNNDGTYTVNSANGSSVVIDATETLTTLVANVNGTLTYTDEENIPQLITTTVLSQNTQIADETIDIDGDGTADSGVTLQDVIDTINTIVTANETITSLSIDAGTLVYTNENGSNGDVPLISADAQNTLSIGSDGALFTAAMSSPWFGTDNDASATLNDEDMYVQSSFIGIGRTAAVAGERLSVDGAIVTTNSIYPDYVFEDYLDGDSVLHTDYAFPSLSQVDAFIRAYKHLPGVTGIKELTRDRDGDYAINITELTIQTLEKVEELYLHTIDQQKEIEKKTQEINALKNRVLEIETILEKLMKE